MRRSFALFRGDLRGARYLARVSRHELVFGRAGLGPLTMMQPCASAAKLRGSGPILSDGSKAMWTLGLPPPRIVIGRQSRLQRRQPKLQVNRHRR